ncbi:uncharacterized protein F4812DRAFT_332625 [Daldinia caldariorum]|uniref:uncharacterized protein n=1 Tax=Daldinia caldariorum TaxID=326644 RepID=UPI002008A761|nr:uncharacterized protein F4812DRAFT_332625 [Daldinia caldariorum]KAI1469498.1 hypothetical protein F4812DRAFT_332625 [Daldinia caldariorum]
MESFFPQGGFQLPFQRRLSRLYNDTKKSSDFVKESAPRPDDPDIKALHRKLRIQKDRLVSWGLEWSDPNQAAEIDESLSKAGLSDLVGSIMATIKDILAEAEPLWLASRQAVGSEKKSEKGMGDRKAPLVVWDKGRFEDLVKDLTASIDTLCDLSRTRSSATISRVAGQFKPTASTEDLRPFSSTRIRTPQQIDLQTLTSLRSLQPASVLEAERIHNRPQEIFFIGRQGHIESSHRQGPQVWSPLLVEYAPFDPIYSATGIMPDMSRFEKLSAGLQTDSQRSPGSWIGLPLLLGYYEDMRQSRLALIYQFPPGFNPVTFENFTQNPLDNLCTLKELLNRPDFEPMLEAKFRLAHNLVNTVFDMHARGITHGNLSASSITFCNANGNDPDLPVGEVDVRRPLVSSFDIFPEEDFRNEPPSTFPLHRHPLDPRTTTQSPLSLKGDTRTLDLYSLATMLVSIGLWTQLENLVPDQGSPSIPESVLRQLAIRCGTPYMKAVQICWDAVDQELSHPGSAEEILSQVQIRASRYLEACCILDGISGLDERISEDPGRFSGRGMVTESLAGPSASSQSTHGSGPQAPSEPGRMGSDTKQAPELDEKPVESTTGHPTDTRSKLRLYPQVPLSTEAIEQWHSILMPQINLALRHFYRKNPESVEISLESIGESPQKTKPTVLVICTSVSTVRAILKKKLGVFFDGSTGFALKVCRGSVARSRKGPTRSMAKDQHSASAGNNDNKLEDYAGNPEAANPGYQEIPQNGASIGAWIGDKHLPPVSFGGLIMVDDKPYGMTVHHMLDDPDLEEEASTANKPGPKRAHAPDRSNAAVYIFGIGSSGEESSDDYPGGYFSDSESELSLTDITSADEESDDDDEFTETGDIPGVEPGCGDGYIVTQPALEDVPEGFYPSEETMDEDHLDTYRLGEMYASSGIRRRNEDGLIHEIDWALFDFEDGRLPQDNLIPRAASSSFCSTTSIGHIHPTEIVPAKSLPGLEVQCIARTSGLQMGQILPALTSVKIYGRSSPSHTYQVSGKCSTVRGYPLPATEDPPKVHTRTRESLGIPGDSGAWIVDRPHGRLCGHVLAWSARKQVAYICPMEVLLRDMAETLEARDIRLPGGKAIIENSTGYEKAEISDSDLADCSERGCMQDDDDDDDEEEEVPTLHDIRKSRAGSHIGIDSEPKVPKRLSAIKRKQLYGYHGETSDDALDADMDKMHI